MDKKQKVLIVHNYYQIPGGEDTVVANEKKLLEEHGHEVILYTRHNSELKNLSFLKKILLPISTIFNLRTYREVKRILKEECIDIVHVHNTLNLISPSVYYAALACKVPVVQTIHNFRMLCPGATFYRDGHICEDCVEKGLWCSVKHKCYRNSRIQTLACVVSTMIHRWTGIYGKINYICLTEFNKTKLLQLKQVEEKQIWVKPNFTFDVSEQCEKKQGKYYLFIGRLEEIKGIDILLDAFSKLPEVVLHVAGSGKEAYEKELQRKGITNIQLLGFLSREQIKEELSAAKALVVTSQIYEGFPMSITEAYANSVPVIAGNIGNSGDLVLEGHTGKHFQFDSAEALAKVIRDFDDTDSLSMGQNAYKVYVESYSPQTNYKKIISIYTAVMKSG